MKYGLREALERQEGEDQPRITVSRKGKPVDYQQLEKMTVEELSSCDITSFGDLLRVSPIGAFIGGPGQAQSSIDTNQSAAKALESIYHLGLAILTGTS